MRELDRRVRHKLLPHPLAARRPLPLQPRWNCQSRGLQNAHFRQPWSDASWPREPPGGLLVNPSEHLPFHGKLAFECLYGLLDLAGLPMSAHLPVQPFPLVDKGFACRGIREVSR